MDEAQFAIRLSPRDPEFHATVGTIYQQMHRYQEAAAAYGNYVNLLPDRDRGDRAMWARETIRFLSRSTSAVPLDFGAEPEDAGVDASRSACSATRCS